MNGSGENQLGTRTRKASLLDAKTHLRIGTWNVPTMFEARSAFARLKPVWKSNACSRATKLRIYKSNVLPVLLYGAECWRMTAKDLSRLSTFHTTCLRRMMRVFRPNRISNSDLLEAAKQEPMNNILKRKGWRWVGHTLRMEPSAHARIALTWTPEGRRKRGCPSSTWRRTMLGN